MIYRCPFKSILLCLMVLLSVVFLSTGAGAADKEESQSGKDPAADKTVMTAAPRANVDPLKIGFIVPLTGKDAEAGNRMLNAVLLGSGVFDRSVNMPFTLMIEDSQNNRERAAKAVSKLADEDGVICIVCLSGEEASEAAAREAQRLKIPILAVTPRKDITAVGDYVFRNFPTDNRQIIALVKYAVEDAGSTRFAVLYPDDPYGRNMKELFEKEVLRFGGRIVKTESYDVLTDDFSAVLNSLMSEETEAGRFQGASSGRRIPFDALFIPDAYIHVRSMAGQPAFRQLQGVQLLGTAAWNHPDLLKMNGSQLEGAVFTDGFFSNSYNPEVNDFTDQYYAAFGREPGLTEAIVFDSTRIVAGILGEKRIDSRDTFRKELLKVKDYPGATGKTSFFQQRDAAKAVFILKISGGQIVQVK